MSLEEEKKTAEDIVKHKRWTFWLILGALLALSMGISDILFNYKGADASYFDYFFVSPFSEEDNSLEYYHRFWWFSLLMFLTTLLIRLFFFGNPKRKYIAWLEKIKRFVLDFIPFYFNGNDQRNNYIRFGMKTAFINGFLERKIYPGKYLKKVSHLNIFTGKYSPDLILNLKNDYIKKSFLSEKYYIELFKIIEAYIKNNIDIVLNIPLKNYESSGISDALYTNESIITFIKDYSDKNQWDKERKIKEFQDFKKKEKKKKNLKEKSINKAFIKKILNNNLKEYKVHVEKMIIFSPLAIKEAIATIEKDAIRFLNMNIKLKTLMIRKMKEYNKDINFENLIEIMKFLIFLKIINNFMGLPSGIVTARIKDYTLSRIVDDIEMAEKNKTIRQIKYGINDQNGKYDDTIARAYMIFHHEFFLKSLNAKNIKRLLEKFNPFSDFSIQKDTEDINFIVNNIFDSNKKAS